MGLYTSIVAVNVSTIYVSYYATTDDDLFVAKSTNGGTTWTPNGGAGDTNASQSVGLYTSIVAVNVSTIYVSYRDNSDLDLFVAESSAGGLITVTVESKDNAPMGF